MTRIVALLSEFAGWGLLFSGEKCRSVFEIGNRGLLPSWGYSGLVTQEEIFDVPHALKLLFGSG